MKPTPSTYRINGLGLSIAVNCDCLEFWKYASKHVVLPSWSVDSSTTELCNFSVQRQNTGLYALYEGPTLHLRGDRETISIHLASLLHHRMAACSNHIVVHAGAVEYRGRVILFPGTSHSGKSSLVKALTEAGCLYYSDEYAVFDPSTEAVQPFPRAIHLRQPRRMIFTPSRENSAEPERRARLGAIFDLKYEPESILTLSPQKRSRTVLTLFENTVAAQRLGSQALDCFQRVTTDVSAWAGTRGCARQAVYRILEHIEW